MLLPQFNQTVVVWLTADIGKRDQGSPDESTLECCFKGDQTEI